MSAPADKTPATGYLHGFTPEEQDRLYRQARFLERKVHDQLPYRRCRRLLEVGCGVGAQTEILLRHFPDLHVTGVDASEPNLAVAQDRLENLGWAEGRWKLERADAGHLDHGADSFDGAFLCWILEHVAEPAQVLSEVRRVLRPGSPVVVTEVQNSTFFLDPYSPHTLAYWTAFNEHQMELGGDPFVGVKLGNLLQAVGFRDITTKLRTFHLDNRHAAERAEILAFWSELLLSGSESLRTAGCVSQETVDGMKAELAEVAHDPNAVFLYSFVQGRARAW
ncbi:MAG: methyltransferase domain-containing protein [Planctomycetota bacterium]|jgi:ubiquinone/menaquinone biosynthesis C-methylase UbiE